VDHSTMTSSHRNYSAPSVLAQLRRRDSLTLRLI
jgi:hypothetical protein